MIAKRLFMLVKFRVLLYFFLIKMMSLDHIYFFPTENLLAMLPTSTLLYSLWSLYHFARASSYVTDFNTRNNLLTQKLHKQGYWYHKLCKTFLNFIDDAMI